MRCDYDIECDHPIDNRGELRTQGFPHSNYNMFLSYKFLEMGAACVPNIRVCGEGRGWDSAPVHYILLLYSQSYPLLNIT